MFYSFRLFNIAQNIVNEKQKPFFMKKGPGKGNISTNLFMDELRKRAKHKFGLDFSEQRICGDTQFAVDFYFPDEATIVEIALSLQNPNREFEKDIIKAVLAKRAGKPIDKLVFISKPGAIQRNEEPGPKAIIAWVQEDYGIRVTVKELDSTQPS